MQALPGDLLRYLLEYAADWSDLRVLRVTCRNLRNFVQESTVVICRPAIGEPAELPLFRPAFWDWVLSLRRLRVIDFHRYHVNGKYANLTSFLRLFEHPTLTNIRLTDAQYATLTLRELAGVWYHPTIQYLHIIEGRIDIVREKRSSAGNEEIVRMSDVFIYTRKERYLGNYTAEVRERYSVEFSTTIRRSGDRTPKKRHRVNQ